MTKKNDHHKFSAEIAKVFKLVVNSIYENKDIFLRELISNASDACDKFRYKAALDNKLTQAAKDLRITVSVNKKEGTITVTDNGIGMSKDELINNLGTIAKSGTEDFINSLKDSKNKPEDLIGKFGVGFTQPLWLLIILR